MKQKNGFFQKIGNFINEMLIYFITVFGVLMSKYIPAFRAGRDISIEFAMNGEFFIACFVALLVTFMLEKDGDEEGKKKNFKRRALTHLAHGALWYTLLGG